MIFKYIKEKKDIKIGGKLPEERPEKIYTSFEELGSHLKGFKNPDEVLLNRIKEFNELLPIGGVLIIMKES